MVEFQRSCFIMGLEKGKGGPKISVRVQVAYIMGTICLLDIKLCTNLRMPSESRVRAYPRLCIDAGLQESQVLFTSGFSGFYKPLQGKFADWLFS